jgi:hypothetical protein
MDRKIAVTAIAAIITGFASSSVAQTGLALQNLPNGDYAFKKGSRSQYIVFRKTGSNIIGQSFSYPSDDGYCFAGEGIGAVITNATIEEMDEQSRNSKPIYVGNQSVSLGEYRPIDLEQVPASTNPAFERCLKVMARFGD